MDKYDIYVAYMSQMGEGRSLMVRSFPKEHRHQSLLLRCLAALGAMAGEKDPTEASGENFGPATL